MPELSVVGKSILRVDALEKVTGKAKFLTDFKLPSMCYAKVLGSRYPHAKIVRIDTSKAEELPGVRAVVTGKDTPDKRFGVMIWDQWVLARDVVRFVGEPVAAVLADTIEIAEDALELIEVDYEELPAVFDVEEAMRADPPVVVHPDCDKYVCIPQRGTMADFLSRRPNVFHTWTICQGDVERGFQEADLIVENRWFMPRVHQSQIELHQSQAWVESDGTLVVRTRAGIHVYKHELCRYFDLPPSKVRVVAGYVGGIFGGKAGDRQLGLISALLAMKSGRPVCLVCDRQETVTRSSGKSPMVVYIKDGVKKDGTIVAREMRLIVEAGAYSQITTVLTRSCCFGAVGTYRIPNFKLNSYGVYTNIPTSLALRGFGSLEPIWAIEQNMDIIAEKLGIDAVELRKKNILREGDKNVVGEITHSIGARECLDKVAEWIEWGKKPAEAKGPWRRGKGIGLGNKFTTTPTTSVVIVKVHQDGVIEVRHSIEEIGQGINTVLAQIAAEEFGISVDEVKIVSGDTAVTPYDQSPISSRATWHTGHALIRACQDAKRQIFEIAAAKLGQSPEAMETKQGRVFVTGWPGREIKISDLFSIFGYAETVGEIIGRGMYSCPYIPEDRATGQSERVSCSYSHGAHAVEVAVDVETGEVKVLRDVGCFDCGQPINPMMCEQQIEGGMSMGMGHTLYEEVVFNRGILVTPSFHDYKIPTSMDLPSGENVKTMLAPAPHREGPFGAKGIGEAVETPVLGAVCSAVYNAVGVRIKDLPLTKEKVLKALEEAGKA